MLQHKISVVIAFIALVSALPNAASAQQKTLKERAIGAWSYVSSTAKAPDGSRSGDKIQKASSFSRRMGIFPGKFSVPIAQNSLRTVA
jgi:hypothetical protein